MAGRDNLVPNSERTPEERRENARKAGVASGRSRRKRKTIRECLEMLLAKDVADEDAREMLAGMGIADSDMQYAMLVAVGLLRKAADGDVQAARLLMEAAGEAQASGSSVVVNIIDDLK